MSKKRIITFVFILMFITFAFTDAPNIVNYQGRLTDNSGNPVADGTYSMTFKIYNIESGDNGNPCGDPGANCLWEEIQDVETKNGIFNVMLGKINSLTPEIFSEADRWLGITVESDSEMVPRQRFASSAYALRGVGGNGFIFKKSGVVTVQGGTTSFDIYYADIDFSENELTANGIIIIELSFSGDTNFRYDLDNTSNNPTGGHSEQGDGYWLTVKLFQDPNDNKILRGEQLGTRKDPTYANANVRSSTSILNSGDINILTTSFTIRLNFKNSAVSPDSHVRYICYFLPG